MFICSFYSLAHSVKAPPPSRTPTSLGCLGLDSFWDRLSLVLCTTTVIIIFNIKTLLKHRSELQEEHYNDLRSELFKHIFMFSSGPRIVLTRLCIAVSSTVSFQKNSVLWISTNGLLQSGFWLNNLNLCLLLQLGAFALNSMPEHWSNAVSDIINTLQNARGSSQVKFW